MPNYKDINGNIHFLSYTDILNGGESYLPPGCIEITDEEANNILNEQKPPPSPNLNGFIEDVKKSMGGIVGINNLIRMYPMFYDSLQQKSWIDVLSLVVDAKNTGTINQTQYNDFQNSFINNNIPITLP